MLLFREIQSRTGGFTEFVPLGFIHDNTLLFAQGLARDGGTLAEHLKVHALARIVLAGSINHIQVSWVKLGREVSQLSLLAGADDYGGTLFEENISRLAGSTAGQYTSAAEFQERILELGRVPAQRNTLYTQYTYPAAGLSRLNRSLPAATYDRNRGRYRSGRLGTGSALGAGRRVGGHRLARRRTGKDRGGADCRESRSPGQRRRRGKRSRGQDVRHCGTYRSLRRAS